MTTANDTNPSRGVSPGAFALGAMAMLAIVAVWSALQSPPAAVAQIPDSGAQFQQLIAEARLTNAKLSEIAATLLEIRDQKGIAPKDDKKAREHKP